MRIAASGIRDRRIGQGRVPSHPHAMLAVCAGHGRIYSHGPFDGPYRTCWVCGAALTDSERQIFYIRANRFQGRFPGNSILTFGDTAFQAKIHGVEIIDFGKRLLANDFLAFVEFYT